jgi:hypothetical protein
MIHLKEKLKDLKKKQKNSRWGIIAKEIIHNIVR